MGVVTIIIHVYAINFESANTSAFEVLGLLEMGMSYLSPELSKLDNR